MNIEQIRAKALEYSKKVEERMVLGVYEDENQLEIDKSYNEGYISGVEDGYIEGLKQNNFVWHDLKLNPKDLPKNYGWYLVSVYCEEKNSFYTERALFDSDDNVWLNSNFEAESGLNNNIRAWIDIPTFEEC